MNGKPNRGQCLRYNYELDAVTAPNTPVLVPVGGSRSPVTLLIVLSESAARGRVDSDSQTRLSTD
jgi:hypothetical protein